MKMLGFIILLGTWGCVAAMAGSDIVPMHLAGQLLYDEATGQFSEISRLSREQRPYWSARDATGLLQIHDSNVAMLQWADMPAQKEIGGISYSWFTNSQDSDGQNSFAIMIYQNENGYNSTGRELVAGFMLDNVPGSDGPLNEYWGFYLKLTPVAPFTLDGADLDGDGLVDFGYMIRTRVLRTPGARWGQAFAAPTDPNQPEYTSGSEHCYDQFVGENYVGTNCVEPPLAPFYFELLEPACPNSTSGAKCRGDLNSDCVVDLQDLAILLSSYGVHGAPAWWEGDIAPYGPGHPIPGDQAVNLEDLAELLSSYGENCSR